MKIKVFYRFLKNKDELYIVGSDSRLGSWDTQKGLRLGCVGGFTYYVDIDHIEGSVEYKFIIKSKNSVYWQLGGNNIYDSSKNDLSEIFHKELMFENYNPKFSGVVAPIFSLRHKKDWGIGDFYGLKLLLKFAYRVNMSVVQILPINDTCITMTAKDSYPYNAISTNAINPMFMDMSCFESQNMTAKEANVLSKIDYNIVSINKYKSIWNHTEAYLSDKNNVRNIERFAEQHNSWLDAYAHFIIMNDTAGLFGYKLSEYNKNYQNNSFHIFFKNEILRIKCIQYILHTQLKDISDYANKKNILLKGDLPIGVNPNGLDVSINKEYFNVDFSAGAPPDDFALDGQNWGFPTYNWDIMETDNFSWWKNRMSSLNDYFSAVRIDHILGFFRIWQIPKNQHSGLLGFFYPSIPLDYNTVNGCLNDGWDIDYLSKPIVHEDYARKLLGCYFEKVIESKLLLAHCKKGFFNLAEETQVFYDNKNDEVSNILRKLCTEVLFIKHNDNYYPRIRPDKTNIFNHIGRDNQALIENIHSDYFFHKNISLWRNVAKKRLSAIKSSSDILLCAEDLGMIPSCVPDVLSELNIMTLEIERMPKEGQETPWCNLDNLPYNSVLSTSTHDMPPLKLYWHRLSNDEKEDYRARKLGDIDLNNEKCVLKTIVKNHLLSSSILCIIPLGDLLSFHDIMSQDASEEQINHPENPDNIWDYRFPFYMDNLIEDNAIIDDISYMIRETERCR